MLKFEIIIKKMADKSPPNTGEENKEKSVQMSEPTEIISKPQAIKIEKEEMDREKIGQFLLDNKMYLSALEFYQENIEQGITLKSLLEFFYKLDTNLPFLPIKKGFFHAFKSHDIKLFKNFIFPTKTDDKKKHKSFNATESTEILELLKEKDQKISLTEYELKLAQENMEALKREISSFSAKEDKVDKQLSALSEEEQKSRQEAVDNLEKETIKAYELKALNYMIYNFLVHNKYQLSGVYFSQDVQEAIEQDLNDWETVGLKKMKHPPPLLSLLRYYMTVGPNKERFEQSSFMKTKELLAETQQKLEKLQIKYESLEKKNRKLESQLKRSENDFKKKLDELNTAIQIEKSKDLLQENSPSPNQQIQTAVDPMDHSSSSLDSSFSGPVNIPEVPKKRRLFLRSRRYDDQEKEEITKDSERIQKQVR